MILYGDARESMVPDGSVNCVVTSPPYFGLRNYGDSPREIGRGSMDDYLTDIQHVAVRMWDALADDGTWWLNIGDTASGSGGAGGDFIKGKGSKEDMPRYKQGATSVPKGQWCMVPARVGLVLQEMGWMLRSQITWDKQTIRPESQAHTRRPGVSSETIFMLTKQSKYKFNPGAIEEVGNVWHFPPSRGKRHHMAPFPEELPRRCILLSTDPGDTVLDPFVGNGTTVNVAENLDRVGIGIDLYRYDDGLVGSE